MFLKSVGVDLVDPGYGDHGLVLVGAAIFLFARTSKVRWGYQAFLKQAIQTIFGEKTYF